MPDFTFGSPPCSRSIAADTSAALKNMGMKYINTIRINRISNDPVCVNMSCTAYPIVKMDNMTSPMAEKIGKKMSSRSFMSTPQLICMNSNVWPIVANIDVNALPVGIVWLWCCVSSGDYYD